MNSLYSFQMKLTVDTVKAVKELLESNEKTVLDKYAFATGMLLARLESFASAVSIVEDDPEITEMYELIKASRI